MAILYSEHIFFFHLRLQTYRFSNYYNSEITLGNNKKSCQGKKAGRQFVGPEAVLPVRSEGDMSDIG